MLLIQLSSRLCSISEAKKPGIPRNAGLSVLYSARLKFRGNQLRSRLVSRERENEFDSLATVFAGLDECLEDLHVES